MYVNNYKTQKKGVWEIIGAIYSVHGLEDWILLLDWSIDLKQSQSNLVGFLMEMKKLILNSYFKRKNLEDLNKFLERAQLRNSYYWFQALRSSCGNRDSVGKRKDTYMDEK